MPSILAHRYLCIYICIGNTLINAVHPSISPKTHFSIPLKKTAAPVTPAQRRGQSTCTSESIPLRNASMSATLGTCYHSNTYAQQAETRGASDSIVETYLIHLPWIYMIRLQRHVCSYMSAAPSAVDIQCTLMSNESGHPATHGQTSWIAF